MLKESMKNIERTLINLRNRREQLRKKQAILDFQIHQQTIKLEKQKRKFIHFKNKKDWALNK